MVTLENIRRTPIGVKCEYNPEGSGMFGTIEIKNDGTLEIKRSPFSNAWGEEYAKRAVKRLQEIVSRGGQLPPRAIVMWY